MELVNIGYAILGFVFGIVFHFLIGVIGEQLRRHRRDFEQQESIFIDRQ